ncbi:MAG TPA: hypothetical protein PLF89_04355 [bacterium]|nr:hypothetical protein [bacterium]
MSISTPLACWFHDKKVMKNRLQCKRLFAVEWGGNSARPGQNKS